MSSYRYQELERWKDLLEPNGWKHLKPSILEGYLMKMRWFGGKGKGIMGIRSSSHAAIPWASNPPAFMLLIEVSYQNDLPELYQLPVAYGKEPFAYRSKKTVRKRYWQGSR
jgi:maltose alpha-D-glucosyltransferase/alpha-amylase